MNRQPLWPILLLVLLAAVVLLVVVGKADGATRTLNLTWTPVPVSCTSMPGAPAGAWGVFHPSTRTVEIRDRLCTAMVAALNGGPVGDEAASGVAVIGHELAHSAGVADETDADCLGYLIYPYVARRLGFAPAQVAAMRDTIRAGFGYGCP